MSLTKPILFIVNPTSGDSSRRSSPDLTDRIEGKMQSLGHVAQVMVTKGKGHAAEITRAAVKNTNWKAIVAVGGDGTVNEVGRNMLHSGIPLGIIPTGSGNGLARHLQIPINFESALHRIIEGSEVVIDSGLLNDFPFFCTSGIGFDAAVSHAFASSSERGLKSYVKYALDTYKEFAPFTVKMGDEATKVLMVTFANAGQFGNNAWIAPQASTTDGQLDLCQVSPFPLWYGMVFSTRLFAKTLVPSKYLTYRLFKELSIQVESPVLAHVDGEPLTLETERLSIRCIPKSLKVIC